MTTSDKEVTGAELSYLGRQSERLSDLIEEQTAILFARHGIQVPVKSCSLIEALARIEPASASDLAAELGRSHQIINQKLPKLIKLKLVERQADGDDKRRFVHSLTTEGRNQAALIGRVTPQIADVYREIELEIGPVYQQIVSAIQSLEKVSIADRLN